MLTLNSYIFCYIGKPILKWHIIMSTLQNYVIFTICQYNILCHFNISFFTVYNMVNMLKTQLINLYITRLRRCIHHHACMHACTHAHTHTHTHTHTTHTQHTQHTHNTHTYSHICVAIMCITCSPQTGVCWYFTNLRQVLISITECTDPS